LKTTLTIHGIARPQGSKSGFYRNGRVVIVESTKGVKEWRAQMTEEIAEHIRVNDWPRPHRSRNSSLRFLLTETEKQPAHRPHHKTRLRQTNSRRQRFRDTRKALGRRFPNNTTNGRKVVWGTTSLRDDGIVELKLWDEDKNPLSACGKEHIDPEIFWNKDTVEEAVSICKTCPIKFACLEYALANDFQEGVWGGLSATDRAQSHKQYNKKRGRQHE
jgi:Transcription factor WhiB